MNGIERRRQTILDIVQQEGACTYEQLARRCNTSTMTIRRDVEALAASGAVLKTIGGILNAQAPYELYETALHDRIATNRREKQSIARKAVALIEPGQVVFLDGSTTCLELASQIAQKLRGVTVITNSITACGRLAQNRDNELIAIGGQLNHDTGSFVGSFAEESLLRYYPHLAFFSTKGFMVGQGTFESSIPTFRIKEIIAKRCEQVILLVDHSKFRQRSLCKVLDVSQIDTVITDGSAPTDQLKQLQEAGVEVLIAEVD